MSTQTAEVTGQRTEVTEYLHGLKPLPDKQTQAQGQLTQNSSGQYLLEQTRKLASVDCVDPQRHLVWPGAIIQGYPYHDKGEIRAIPNHLDHAPGRVTIPTHFGYQPDVTAAPSQYRDLDTVHLGTVTDAINDMIVKIDPTQSAGHSQHSMDTYYSMEQAMLGLSLNFSGFGAKVKGSFNYSHKTSQSAVLIDYWQVFYTVNFQPKDGHFFAGNVELDALKEHTSKENPPLYFSDVSYGIRRLILAWSEATETELRAALEASFSTGKISAGVELESKYQKTLKRTQLKIITLGTTMDSQEDNDGSNFSNYIKPIKFSKSTPGAVVSATARYLSNNKVAGMFLTASWSQADPFITVHVGEGEENYRKDTSIKAKQNERYLIKASGKYWNGMYNVTADGMTLPDGKGGNVSWPAPNDYPAPGKTWYGLIGRWGDGPWFNIGSYKLVTCSEQDIGKDLILSINDNDLKNGNGTLKVTIEPQIGPTQPDLEPFILPPII